MTPFDRLRPGEGTTRGSRGVSEVLGIVLVLGMVVTATLVIVTVGATTFQESQEQVSMESAVTKMADLNDRIRQVATQPGERSSMSLSDMDGANLHVEETGWINISVEYQKNGTVVDGKTSGNIKLGKIVYERGTQSVVLQAGGIWRTNENGASAAMLEEPPFEYKYEGGDPTVALSPVQLSGVSIDGGTVTVEQAGAPTKQLVNVNPIKPGQQVNITVHSEFYKNWHDQFAAEPAKVGIDHSAETAKIVLPGPPQPKGLLNNALGIPGNAVFAGGFQVKSYDSRTKQGNGSVGVGNYREHQNGDVVSTESVTTKGSNIINGDVFVNGSFDNSGGSAIHGDLYVREGTTSGGVDGSIYAGGDVVIDKDLSGDVVTNGDVHINKKMQGDVHAGGDVIVNTWEMYGDIVAEGNVTVKAGMDGNISAGKNVTLKESVNGDINAGNDILIDGKYGLAGDAKAGGDLIHDSDYWNPVLKEDKDLRVGGDILSTGKGHKFKGEIHAKGNVSINGTGSELTSTGSVTVGGVVDIVSENGHVNKTDASKIDDPTKPKPPEEPNLDAIQKRINSLPEISSRIETAVTKYKANNDNSKHPDFDSLGGKSVEDTLEAGKYYYDGDLEYGGNPSLTFDTTGGDIHLAIDGEFIGKNLNANIVGDNRVYIYVTGNVDITGNPNFVNSEGRGDQLWLFAGDESEGPSFASDFYGVILSEATVDLKGSAEVYGAIVSPGAGISGGQRVFFDEALLEEEEEDKKRGGPGTVTYVKITTSKVDVAGEE